MQEVQPKALGEMPGSDLVPLDPWMTLLCQGEVLVYSELNSISIQNYV